MQKILREWDPIPTAVFAANDMMALGTIHALQSANLKVPEDVSVIGFDNIDQCTYSVPQLTTVSVDIGLTAKVAAANLFRLIRTRSQEAYKIIIPTELILRRSTMPLAVVHRKKEPVC
jgi:LacI family transcriptional regulator